MNDESLKEHDELCRLLSRVQEGSEEATAEVVARFGPYIRRVVRRLLDDRFRSVFDSCDLEQTVWTAIFADRDALRVSCQPREFKRYLAILATNKTYDEIRRNYYSPTHGVQRETSLDGSAAATVAQLRATDPTPSQVAVAQETWQKVTGDLPRRQQEIVRQRYEGATQMEIAAALGIDERTVRRVLKHAQAQQNP